MAALTLTGSSQTLILDQADDLEASVPPQTALRKIPGRTGNLGQGLSRESPHYVATGQLKGTVATVFTDFPTKLATMVASQASSPIHATFVQNTLTLLDSDVWIQEAPRIKTRKGTSVLIADWVVEMVKRE